MFTARPTLVSLALAIFALLSADRGIAGIIRVATYNVETYLDQPTERRTQVKSPEARAKIRETIRAASPDVIALEEMGDTNALLELRASLQADGQDFPFWGHLPGFDPDIHLAVLSKLPITGWRPHTNEFFVLDGRRLQVKRGFAEFDVQAGTNLTITLIAAHLKSRLPTAGADESEERLQEAKSLRELIDARLKSDAAAKLIVLGDFNDGRDSASTKQIIGRGKTKLFDTRPAERNGDSPEPVPPYHDPRNVAWTYYFGKSDEYSRIDYILVSPALKSHWLARETFIPAIPNWGKGSDHRLIVAGFDTEARD
jgi:endonuclease/exonuclease/phosphatase family metal-dependent hydrolase